MLTRYNIPLARQPAQRQIYSGIPEYQIGSQPEKSGSQNCYYSGIYIGN